MSEANLGETVRRLRGVAQLSLRSLAEKTGFSASFLSQVENGQASPSIASMERIAAALGVTMGQIFDAAQQPSSSAIVRSDARVTLTSGWSKARIESLGNAGPGGRLESVLLTLEPGGKSGTRPYSSEREEFAWIVQGTVKLTLAEPGQGEGGPQREYSLQGGDSVTIRATVPRQWQNLSEEVVKVMMVSVR